MYKLILLTLLVLLVAKGYYIVAYITILMFVFKWCLDNIIRRSPSKENKIPSVKPVIAKYNRFFEEANDINNLSPQDRKRIDKAIYSISDVLTSNGIRVSFHKAVPMVQYVRYYYRIAANSYRQNGERVWKTPDERQIKKFISTISRSLKISEESIEYTHTLDGYQGIVFTIPRINRPKFTLGDIIYKNSVKEYIRNECKEGRKWLHVPLIFGLDLNNQPLIHKIDNNLTHILVAGATGGGKTIGAKSMLYSMMHLMKSALEVWMVDVKQTEFQNFKRYDFPSKGRYVTNDYVEIEKMVDDAIALMDKRQKEFVNNHVNDIQSYNHKMPLDRQMRHLVLFIDELQPIYAWDKENNKGSIYKKLQLLATQARSVGIILFLGTQRPDATILPQNLKANIGAKVGLVTKTKPDSQIIVNTSDCVNLKGSGDALLSQPTKNVHFQFPFLSDEEIDNWFKKYGAALDNSTEDVVDLPYNFHDL